MIFYSYFAPLVFINALAIFIISSFTANKKTKLLTIFIISLLSLIPRKNVNLIMLVNGYFSLLSITSTILFSLYIINSFVRHDIIKFDYTLYAFVPILLFFYGFSTVAFTPFYPYSYGFAPLYLVSIIGIYALSLAFISKRFFLFNVLVLFAIVISHSKFLGNNLWNYLIDPIILFWIIIFLITNLIKKATKCAIQVF